MGTDIKDSITTREKEILYLLSRGLNSKEIAAELFISAHTVEYHRRQLLKKTNSRNIAQLIGNAFRMGILWAVGRGSSPQKPQLFLLSIKLFLLVLVERVWLKIDV